MPAWMEFLKTNPDIEQIESRIFACERLAQGAKSMSETINYQSEQEALTAIRNWAHNNCPAEARRS